MDRISARFKENKLDEALNRLDELVDLHCLNRLQIITTYNQQGIIWRGFKDCGRLKFYPESCVKSAEEKNHVCDKCSNSVENFTEGEEEEGRQVDIGTAPNSLFVEEANIDEHTSGDTGINWLRANASLFDETTATEDRSQLLKLPITLAHLNALRLAGYSAEMDAEGLIWFDDDDADPYYDAPEFQTASDEEEERSLLGHRKCSDCTICKNMKKEGFGGILAESEQGISKAREFHRRRRKHRG